MERGSLWEFESYWNDMVPGFGLEREDEDQVQSYGIELWLDIHEEGGFGNAYLIWW